MTPPIHVGLAQHNIIKRGGGAVSHTTPKQFYQQQKIRHNSEQVKYASKSLTMAQAINKPISWTMKIR